MPDCRALVAYACNPSYSVEAEIRRISVRSQPEQKVRERLSQKKKKNPQKQDGGVVAQDVGTEFKPHYPPHTKKNPSTDYMPEEQPTGYGTAEGWNQI
jgi:hypothetical protein